MMKMQTISRREIAKRSLQLALAGQVALPSGSAAPTEGLDPVTSWAAIAACEFQRFPNHERSPLGGADLVYGKANNIELRLDVVTAGPETEMRPTVLSIHGGGWVHLMKEDTWLYNLPYLAQGMDAVNIEYRLANQSPAPAAVEDCRCALHWVHEHAAEYGFDKQKLVLAGESAGGHLALMTGMLNAEAGFDNACAYSNKISPVGVSAIVNFCGITDVADLLDGANRRSWAVEWLGANPERERLARQLSPLSYVRSGLPPIISIHGTKDNAVPYEHAVRLHQALEKAGVPNELVTIPGGGHGMRGWPRPEGQRAHFRIFRFLKEHGTLSA
jgi:acetyl esterase/lipase